MWALERPTSVRGRARLARLGDDVFADIEYQNGVPRDVVVFTVADSRGPTG